MGNNQKIRIHHLTRVEGHGNIVVEIKNGRLAEVRFEIVEAPRFFEVILRGQHYDEVTHIASRICGICAVSHKCAALKATEAALNVRITDQTLLLRRLAYHGEVISSHMLHVYFLAGPDYFNADSVFALVKTHREMVLRAMRLKNLGYELSALVAGRHTHPVAMAVGGFRFVHSEGELAKMKKRLAEGIGDIRVTVQDFKALDIPQFERRTEYVSLKHPQRYAFYEGDMFSSQGGAAAPARYREIIDALLEAGIDPQAIRAAVPENGGRGIGAVEAPRGILFHDYEYDNDGRCLSANLVIPTAQNLANIEADMRSFVPARMAEDRKSLAHQLEMLVRAYDPCISCSTHVLEL